MPLSPGTRLGPYEIVAPIGKGGMGEVYRARDTRLKRAVALKVLPEAFAADPDRMARFQREAEVLASLNHPHIAQIYGIEDRALAMELVEGETLACPLPVETALDYARQIAEALEAAHEKGITHRDLKPANIMVTPQGVVKVLDFGLAAVAAAPAGRTADSVSPTLTMRATQAGVIMGTAAYMSPEQAAGKPVDKRADIWSYGVVLWEMLTGRRMFDGETLSHTLADVLRAPIDFDKLPAETPPAIRVLLRRCLDRDVKNRLRDIGEARVAIDKARADEPAPALLPEASRPSKLRWLPWAIAGAAVVGLAFVGLSLWRASRPVERPLVRLNVDLGPGAVAGASNAVALSPDGTRIVFSYRGADGKPMLATRLLDQPKATLISGTENGHDPFFAPDSQWIGFFADGKMKKVALAGGAVVTLCEVRTPLGASWGEDGNIIFAPTLFTLARISANGGAPQPLTFPRDKGPTQHIWPQVLPGGGAVLFTTETLANSDAHIEALSLKTGEQKNLVPGGYFGRYLPTSSGRGHLVYIREGTMFGVPFDPARLEIQGAAVPMLEDVAGTLGSLDALAHSGEPFAFAQTGTLVYMTGEPGGDSRTILWLDKTGKTTPLLAQPGRYYVPRFSPDGRRVAFVQFGAKGADIWVYDWQRDTRTQLTFTAPGNRELAWTPDGKHIVFAALSPDSNALWWIRADGSGEPQRLLELKRAFRPQSFSPEGRRLAFSSARPIGQGDFVPDIWTLPLDLSDPDRPKPGTPEPFLTNPFAEADAAFSPDGHWMAYSSSEPGLEGVFVRPFPGPGGKWRISTAGGKFPVWSRTARELFYLAADDRIMVAEYTAKGDSFIAGKPRVWSETRILRTGVWENFDLAPDGKRCAVFPRPESGEDKGSAHVIFLLNFFDELRRRAPVGGGR